MGRGRRVGGRRGHAAAVLVSRVRAEVERAVVVGRGVDGLGPGDVGGGDVRAEGGGVLVEVWRGRVTVTTVGFGRVFSTLLGCGGHREPAHGHTDLLLPARALGQGVRHPRATGGCWGAAALFALLQTTNNIRGSGDDLRRNRG